MDASSGNREVTSTGNDMNRAANTPENVRTHRKRTNPPNTPMGAARQ